MPAHSQTSTAAIVAAGRRLLEERGMDALTMRDVADAVGVRAPSLYKRVNGRADLFRLILEDVADELTSALDAAAGSGDPVADLRAMTAALPRVRPLEPGRVHAHVRAAGTARRHGAVRALLRHTPAHRRGAGRPGSTRCPAARTVVAWANGFITMELAGAFRLGGDVEQAWDFGLDRILTAVRSPARAV